METPFTEVLHEALAARGVDINAERGLMTFKVGNQRAYAMPVEPALTEPEPQMVAARALVGLAEYAAAADAVTRDVRLSAVGKEEDLRKLGTDISTRLNALLDEAGAAWVSAQATAQSDLLPPPVPAADAAQATVDGELRGLLRQMDSAEAMRALEKQNAFLVAVLRQPLALDPRVVDHAQRLWAERNPNSATPTAAMRASASWGETRKIVGASIAAVTKLSGARVPALAA